MKTTLVQTARKQYADAHADILTLLQISELNHNTFVYDCGLKFLKQIGLHPGMHLYSLMERDRGYWNWYKSEWYFAQRDWLKNLSTLKNVTHAQAIKMYVANMKVKCIESRQLVAAFDAWMK